MPAHRVDLTHTVAAPVEAVFDFFSDHDKFGRLWPAKIRRIRTGEREANGVGSVREIRIGPLRFEETIVSSRRPELLEYRISRGGPLRNHHGRIEFHPCDTGTRIVYTISFDARVPFTGGLIARQLAGDWARGIGPVAAEIEAGI